MVSVETDVFVLLMHFYLAHNLRRGSYMVPTNIIGTAVNTEATVNKHIEIAYPTQPLHTLTCFNTVHYMNLEMTKPFEKGIILQSLVNWV